MTPMKKVPIINEMQIQDKVVFVISSVLQGSSYSSKPVWIHRNKHKRGLFLL